MEFLAIDHTDGNGTRHRHEIGRNITIYDWIVQNDYPEEFRVLCHNCNSSHGFYGYCPHKDGKHLEQMILEHINKPNPKQGSRHGCAILTEEQVLAIKQRLNAKERAVDLAREFGVGQGTISHIKHKRQWKHVEDLS